jgi:ABC-2 type transport system ATP-binding protein
MLEAQHLVKRFHGHAAVSDVSFTLAPGEILGYLGPNGSGKSITLNMLTGLVEPTSGYVRYDDVDVTGGAAPVSVPLRPRVPRPRRGSA